MIEARSTARDLCRAIGVLFVWMIAFATLSGLAVAQPASPAVSTVAPLTAESDVEITFPQGIVISADLAWTGDVTSAELELLYSVAGDETLTLVFLPDHIPDTGETVRVETAINLQALAVPPGVPIEFRWRLVDDGSTIAESEPERTTWFDNRWDWNLIESDQVRVHYYDLDPGFAAGILDSAQGTVTELEERYNLDRSAPLDVWIYPSSEDFRGAQLPNSRESIAGASYPGFFLITAVIPDGSKSEIGRVIPHEVSHQVLYQATDNPFTYPPLWFDEGMATHFQVGGTDGYLEMVSGRLKTGRAVRTSIRSK